MVVRSTGANEGALFFYFNNKKTRMFFRGLRCSKTFCKCYWSFVPKIAHQ
jgi:hypothetical protein